MELTKQNSDKFLQLDAEVQNHWNQSPNKYGDKLKVKISAIISIVNKKYVIDQYDVCLIYVVDKIIRYINGDRVETKYCILICTLSYLLTFSSAIDPKAMNHIQLFFHLLSHNKELGDLIVDLKNIKNLVPMMKQIKKTIQDLREKHNPSVSSLHGGGDWKHIYHKNKYHHNLLKIK
jgi:hypothetical protein